MATKTLTMIIHVCFGIDCFFISTMLTSLNSSISFLVIQTLDPIMPGSIIAINNEKK